MSDSNKSVFLMLFIAISLVVFDGRLAVRLEENEQVVDDFDTGTATYWQGLKTNDSTTFWHLSMHGEALSPGINLLRPPSEEGDGFLEVFPVSDSPAQIFSSVFHLLPGAAVEMTYWKFDGSLNDTTGRNTVLLLYKELKEIDDDTGTKPSLKTVLVYSAPFSTDVSLWVTVPIDLNIEEPSNIQLRIDGYVVNANNIGLVVSKIMIKNGMGVSTVSLTTETSTMSQSTTEMTSTSLISSTSTTLMPTTISSSSTTSTMITNTVTSSSNPTSILSNTSLTISSSSSSSLPSSNTSSTVSTSSFTPSTDSVMSSSTSIVTPTQPPVMSSNQLRDILIGVGVLILLFFLSVLLFFVCYKRYRRRAYLVKNMQLKTGIIRPMKKFDHQHLS